MRQPHTLKSPRVGALILIKPEPGAASGLSRAKGRATRKRLRRFRFDRACFNEALTLTRDKTETFCYLGELSLQFRVAASLGQAVELGGFFQIFSGGAHTQPLHP
jgi:hypothetical protein